MDNKMSSKVLATLSRLTSGQRVPLSSDTQMHISSKGIVIMKEGFENLVFELVLK